MEANCRCDEKSPSTSLKYDCGSVLPRVLQEFHDSSEESFSSSGFGNSPGFSEISAGIASKIPS